MANQEEYAAASGKREFGRRWAGFVAAIWLMVFSGTYGFSNYSTALKEVLGLSQTELNTLSVAKDLGDSAGIVAGVLSNYVPAWVLLCVGACVGVLGFGTQWLVVSGTIDPLPFWMMFAVGVLAGNTVSWMNTAVFTVSVRNFPRNRGPVVGLFKAYMGLSAAVYSKICDTLFSSSASMYVLMLLLVPPSFSFLAAVFLRPVAPSDSTAAAEEAEEDTSLLYFNVLAAALAVYLVLVDFFLPDDGFLQRIALGVMFALVVTPVVVPLAVFYKGKRRAELGDDEQGKQHTLSNGSAPTLKQPLLQEANGSFMYRGPAKPATRFRGEARCCCQAAELGEDRATLALLRSWDFYVLYLALFCGAGAGVTFSNNLGQIGQSFGFSSVTLFTSFFSLGNFFGRIASGILSERFLRCMGMPRPAWLGVARLPMIAMFAWLATGSQTSLYVASLVLGGCHGAFITLTIPTVSEFYGLKNLGTNFMVTNTHLLAGSLTFSGIMAGHFYDIQARKQQGLAWLSDLSSDSLTCYGSSCFGTTFIILAALLGATLCLDAFISYYSAPLYCKLKRMNARLS